MYSLEDWLCPPLYSPVCYTRIARTTTLTYGLSGSIHDFPPNAYAEERRSTGPIGGNNRLVNPKVVCRNRPHNASSSFAALARLGSRRAIASFNASYTGAGDSSGEQERGLRCGQPR